MLSNVTRKALAGLGLVGVVVVSSVATTVGMRNVWNSGGLLFPTQQTQLMTVDFPATTIPTHAPGGDMTVLFTQPFTAHNAGRIQVTSLFEDELVWPEQPNVLYDGVAGDDFSIGSVTCGLLVDGAPISPSIRDAINEVNNWQAFPGITATSSVGSGKHTLALSCQGGDPAHQGTYIAVRSHGTSMIIVS